MRAKLGTMKISVQLYTLRDLMGKGPAGTLKELGKMGYRYVETAGTAGKTPKEFAQMIADAGMKVSGMHIGLEPCEKDIEAVLAEAEALSAPFVIVPWVPESSYKDGWEKLGVRLQAVGEKVSKAGLRFAYHNHTFEFEFYGGKTGWDRLFEASCPDHVQAQLDVWWAYCGKHDPALLLKRYAGRCPLVHLKDGADCKAATQLETGRGVQKWDEILKACEVAGVEYGVVELDNCPNPPLESVKTCLEFFRGKGYLE